MISKGIRTIRAEGFKHAFKIAIRTLYNNTIRPHLPRRVAEYNGVTVQTDEPVGAPLVSWPPSFGNIPLYESGLCDAIREHADYGDVVTIVGGGYGASTVIAARQVGSTGLVHTYEASEEFISLCRGTVELNSVDNWVTVHGKTVGEPGNLYGEDAEPAPVVHPDDLPTSDVMAIDAEGAEQTILRAMEERPKTLIVESHGQFDSPSDELRELLEKMGYTIDNEVFAEEREPVKSHCIKHDIKVITARYQ